MNKFLSLTRVLLVTGTTPFAQNKNKKIKGLLLYAILMIAFIPIAISVGKLGGEVYDALVKIDQEGTVLSLAYTIMSMLILVFGVFYVLSVFYFSKDVENLLPLPLKPAEILGAKFLVTLIYEYLIEALFLLPVIISYGMKSGGGILYYFVNLIIFLTIPVIPLIISSILSMILMRFTNIGKNKDRFKVISSVVLILIIFGFNMYTNKLSAGNTSPQHLQNLLAEGNNSLIDTITRIFINAKLATLAVVNLGTLKGLINLVLYLVVIISFMILFLIFGQSLYFKGVIGLNQTSTKSRKLTMDILEKGTESSSLTKALVTKELRSLFRTPVYFINCILMNFLWPIFLVFPMILQPGGLHGIQGFRDYISKGEGSSVALVIAFLISIFITATNCITSTSISREGQNLFFLKYIPINYKKQLGAKILTGISIGLVGVFFMIIVAVFLLKPSPILILLVILASIIGIILSAEIGMLLDLYFPKLIWDNEQKAVKQNLNVFTNMVLGSAIAGLLVYFTVKFNLSLITVVLLITILYGALDYSLYKIIMTIGVKQLKNLEN